jgi:hypothetical protein
MEKKERKFSGSRQTQTERDGGGKTGKLFFLFAAPSEIHHLTNLLCFQGFVYVSNFRNHR